MIMASRYNVTDPGTAADMAKLAKERGAGLIDITDGNQPNPYNTIPAENFMQSLIGAISGGKPNVADPSPWPEAEPRSTQPSGLTVTASD